jgi:hypothetical protein
MTVSKNLPSFNPASISTFMNKVNSQPWGGFPAGTVRIMDIQAQNQFSEDFEFWAVTISFQVRRGYGTVTDARAWWHRCAHQGYIVDDGSGDLIHALTDDGLTVAQPVMIIFDESNPTAPGTGEQAPAGTGYYKEFQVLETIDFNTLNLL